jgi:hypothetical protein
MMGLAFFATRRQAASFIQAKRDAFRSMGITLQKRKIIQQQRRVSLDYLEHIFTQDWIGPRWREKFRRGAYHLHAAACQVILVEGGGGVLANTKTAPPPTREV